MIDYISGLVLLAASVFAFWLRKKTLAPEIFGFVSSLTRDNPHFPVQVGDSALDGISRARALKNVKVKFGDVNSPQELHGRLAFVPATFALHTAPLTKERKYA